MTHIDRLKEIEAANFHRKGLKCLKLFQVEPEFMRSLKTEALELVNKYSPSNVGSTDHVTNWTGPYGTAVQFSLLNRDGNFQNFSTDHNLSILNKQFHYGQEYPAIAEFIKAFPHAINMRLNGMGKNSGLSPHEEHIVHRDKKKGTYFLRARFHLPIQTNSDCSMLLDKEFFRFEEGYIYFFNNGTVHAARNFGNDFRFHFVWDLLLTRESYGLMFSGDLAGPTFMKRVPQSEQSVPKLGDFQQGEYRISGYGQYFYQRTGAKFLGIKPYQFQNVLNLVAARIPRRLAFAEPQ